MRVRSQLDKQPIFIPSVASFPQGMITQIPLELDLMTGNPTAENIHDILAERYSDSLIVNVSSLADTAEVTTLDAELMAGRDGLQIHIFSHADKRQVLLAAVYDNLGKGASGAAVQNLNLMLEGV
jgi:N-acetyl-gamma-glutamyl-phosphate reductase